MSFMGDTQLSTKAQRTDVLDLLKQFSRIGATSDGGVSRLAASKEDGEIRDFLCAWFKQNDFTVRVDRTGNIFGILQLAENGDGSAFYCGSHLDSQPNGGRFDGALGVASACVAALAIRTLCVAGKIDPAFDQFVVACWTGEEGSRFQPSLIGSAAFTDRISFDDALSSCDCEGLTLGEALTSINYLGKDTPPKPHHYFELHIEQSSGLQDANTPVGIVTSSWGALKCRISIVGRSDHTGPTPMEDRRDALLAASHLIIRANEISKAASEPLYSSVGRIEVLPNSPNTIAESASLWVEFRSPDPSSLRNAQDELEQAMCDIANRTGCELEAVRTTKRAVVEFDANAVQTVRDCWDAANISYLKMKTIAGHDAVNLQSVCPSTLMFVPSNDGISHSPEEFTSDEDIASGFEGMLHALSALISRPYQSQVCGGDFA